MSSRQQVERALRRAAVRDKKHKTKMKVSGKSVFSLGRLIGRP